MMKKTLLATALMAASTATVAEISGNVTMASDYVFRGISQTDLYVGYSGEYKSFGYDLGYLRYQYPGFSAAGTNEYYVTGSYSDFSLSVNYSPELNFLPSNQSAWYLKGAYETTLPWYEIGFSAHVGYNTGDAFDVSLSDRLTGDSGFFDSYTDWSIGVSKNWMGADFGLTYTDLDLDSKDDCHADFCDSKVVFSIGKSL